MPANLFDVILYGGHHVSYMRNRLAKGLLTDFANKVLLEHSHVHLFMYYHLWLFPCCNCQVEELCQRLFGLQNLKYDLILYIKKVCWPLVYDCCIVVAQSLSGVQLFVAPWTVTHQAPLSMRFPGQEYWSGLPFPPPGDLPNPGLEPMSAALAGGFFTTEPPGKPI